jgi:hypothetical protein
MQVTASAFNCHEPPSYPDVHPYQGTSDSLSAAVERI